MTENEKRAETGIDSPASRVTHLGRRISELAYDGIIHAREYEMGCNYGCNPDYEKWSEMVVKNNGGFFSFKIDKDMSGVRIGIGGSKYDDGLELLVHEDGYRCRLRKLPTNSDDTIRMITEQDILASKLKKCAQDFLGIYFEIEDIKNGKIYGDVNYEEIGKWSLISEGDLV